LTDNPAPRPRRFSIVACARWEENDIVEWLEYHRAIGIDHFYIYSNDDTPVTLLKTLSPYIYADDPIVTYRHWPIVGQQPQIYFHFLENCKHETEWFSFLDIDEFMVFRNVDSIAAFMEKFERNHDAVYLNWLHFGNNYLVERDPDSTLFAYTRRARQIDHHTKMITRSAAIDAALVRERFTAGGIGFWHFWNDYGVPEDRLTNVILGSVAGYTADFPKQALEYVRRPNVSETMINTAFIAHFQLKSERDFLRRAERGGFEFSTTWGQMYQDGRYRQLLDRMNAVEDTYLAAFWARRVGAKQETGLYSPVPRPALPNIALRKPARQSSRSPEPPNHPRAHVQGHGNDGVRTGVFGFHTAQEDAPWWAVDLLDPHELAEIHLYNRVNIPGVAERASHIALETSLDGEIWTEIFAHDGSRFGGIGAGGPLVVRPAPGIVARHLRVISRRRTALHLDEVEVYGRLVSENNMA
jgi:hypothetical protein